MIRPVPPEPDLPSDVLPNVPLNPSVPRSRRTPWALAWAVAVLVAYLAARAHVLDAWFAR